MMTAYQVMEANQKFEQECFEQAKRELDSSASSGIEYVRELAKLAQRIKLARRGAK